MIRDDSLAVDDGSVDFGVKNVSNKQMKQLSFSIKNQMRSFVVIRTGKRKTNWTVSSQCQMDD